MRTSLAKALWLTGLAALLLVSGCALPGAIPATEPRMPGGNPQRGLLLIQEYGCHSCHHVPGVPGPPTMVGPPLIYWAERHYIAGSLPNTADNLLLWIRYPQRVEPGTAMPDLNVSAADARDIGAYLYTLEDD